MYYYIFFYPAHSKGCIFNLSGSQTASIIDKNSAGKLRDVQVFSMKWLQCLGLTCFTYTAINNDTLIMVLCSSGLSCDLSSAKIMDTTLNIQEMKDQTHKQRVCQFLAFLEFNINMKVCKRKLCMCYPYTYTLTGYYRSLIQSRIYPCIMRIFFPEIDLQIYDAYYTRNS